MSVSTSYSDEGYVMATVSQNGTTTTGFIQDSSFFYYQCSSATNNTSATLITQSTSEEFTFNYTKKTSVQPYTRTGAAPTIQCTIPRSGASN